MMRNDVLEGIKIIEKFRAKKRKDQRRFYFWYSDTLQQVLPVEIIKICRVADESCENPYNVMVHYQSDGNDTWENRFVRACDLFNSRKELQDVIIARKLKEIEQINNDVRCDVWHKSKYNITLGRYVTPDEAKKPLLEDIAILCNL